MVLDKVSFGAPKQQIFSNTSIGENAMPINSTATSSLEFPQAVSGSAVNLFEDKENGFSFSYPNGWRPQKIDKKSGFGISAVVFSSLEESNDDFAENVTFAAQNLSATSSKNLNSFVDSIVDQNKKVAGDAYTPILRDATVLSGQPAIKVIYKIANAIGSKTGKGMMLVAFRNNKAYILVYGAEEAAYNKFLDAANYIIGSFKID